MFISRDSNIFQYQFSVWRRVKIKAEDVETENSIFMKIQIFELFL